jgi:hypothetical protein
MRLTGTDAVRNAAGQISWDTPPVSTPVNRPDPADALAAVIQARAACQAGTATAKTLAAADAARVWKLTATHAVRAVLDAAAAPDREYASTGHRRLRTARAATLGAGAGIWIRTRAMTRSANAVPGE